MVKSTLSRDKYLARIHDPEKITLLRRLLDLMEISIQKNVAQFSDFLDPYERSLSLQISSSIKELRTYVFPEDIEMERKIMVFTRGDHPLEVHGPLSVLKLESKLVPLQHSNILGAILSLGVERNKIGDISVHNTMAFIVVKKEIAPLIEHFLDRVGKNRVKVSRVSMEDYSPKEEEWIWSTRIISSLRIDAIVSEILNLSRAKAKKMIEKGSVKVDYKPILTAHNELDGPSILSIRGYGRYKIGEDISMTKKGKIRISYGILKKEVIT